MTEPADVSETEEPETLHMQWDGTEENAQEILGWIDPTITAYFQKEFPPLADSIVISTPYGNARARATDYIVKTPTEGYTVVKAVLFPLPEETE